MDQDLRAELIAQADAAHSQHPQYKNHWDNWGLARIKRKITTRSPDWDLEEGMVVLLEPLPPGWNPAYRTVYNSKSHCDSMVPASRIEELG